MQQIRNITAKVDVFVRMLSAAFLIGIFVVTLLQIIFRYFFRMPLNWADELSRYLTIYLCFVGSAIAIYTGSHPCVDMLTNALPKVAQNVIEKIVIIINIVIFTMLFVWAIKLNIAPSTIKQVAPSIGISMGFVYFALVLGLGLCLIQSVFRLILTFEKNADTENQNISDQRGSTS